MASERLTYPLDHGHQEALNFVLQVINGDRSILKAGAIWIDSSGNSGDGVIKWVETDGSTIRSVPLPSEGGGDADTLDGNLPSYFLARANHTGTQLADTISNLAATVQAYRLDQFANPTASLNANSQKIINLAAGTDANDAVRLGQVQSAVSGLASTSYVDSEISDLIGGAGAAYDTLQELQALLEGDAASIAAINTAIAARARKFTASFGDGSATQIDIVHNFGNRDNIFSIEETASPWGKVRPGTSEHDTNTIRLNFTTAPTTNQYRIKLANVG